MDYWKILRKSCVSSCFYNVEKRQLELSVLDQQVNRRGKSMPNQTEFPFANARKISELEVIAAEQAIKQQFGIDFTQRKTLIKNGIDNYLSVSIQLHPKIIAWAKAEAEKKELNIKQSLTKYFSMRSLFDFGVEAIAITVSCDLWGDRFHMGFMSGAVI